MEFPKSPKKLMTPAVQQQLAGVFSFIRRAAVFRVLSHRVLTGKHGLGPADGA
jgi:hypothetical protein